MATKLSQLLAVEKSFKTRRHDDLTAAHHSLQKTALLTGLSRSYKPVADEGDQLPPESTRVQVRAKNVINDVKKVLGKLFDVTAMKDFTNQLAHADVVVDGKTILKEVPVSYLLWLEKELNDLHTFVAKLPTLDPADTWQFDAAQDCYATPPYFSTRSKKVKKVITKSEATKEHPAQVETFDDDQIVGHWTAIKYSGALYQSQVTDMLDRVESLQQACKFAREQANTIECVKQPPASRILDYIFGE